MLRENLQRIKKTDIHPSPPATTQVPIESLPQANLKTLKGNQVSIVFLFQITHVLLIINSSDVIIIIITTIFTLSRLKTGSYYTVCLTLRRRRQLGAKIKLYWYGQLVRHQPLVV